MFGNADEPWTRARERRTHGTRSRPRGWTRLSPVPADNDKGVNVMCVRMSAARGGGCVCKMAATATDVKLNAAASRRCRGGGHPGGRPHYAGVVDQGEGAGGGLTWPSW